MLFTVSYTVVPSGLSVNAACAATAISKRGNRLAGPIRRVSKIRFIRIAFLHSKPRVPEKLSLSPEQDPSYYYLSFLFPQLEFISRSLYSSCSQRSPFKGVLCLRLKFLHLARVPFMKRPICSQIPLPGSLHGNV